MLTKTLAILFLSITTTTSALRADEVAEKVNQLFAPFDKAGSPGCTVGVIHDGSFIYVNSYGYASLELGVPLTPGSIFYMGSVSKQFTAASIVLAAEQGYLSLDDDVHKYLPELPRLRPPNHPASNAAPDQRIPRLVRPNLPFWHRSQGGRIPD